MNIKGKVTDKERFFEFLSALLEAGKTGALVVTDGEVARRLFFEKGAIVGATSTAPGESLGELLVERAIIQEHMLQNAEALQGPGPALLGQKLVDLGVMSEEEVQLSIRLKVKKTIADIVSNPEARFEFVDEQLPDKRKVPVSIDVRQLLAPEPERFEKRAPPAVVTLSPDPEPQAPEPADDSALLEVLEKFQEKSPSATLPPSPRPARPREPTPSRPPRREAVPPRSRVAGIAGAAVVASLALAGTGYWFLGKDGKHREEPPEPASREEPSTPSAPLEARREPTRLDERPVEKPRQDPAPSIAATATPAAPTADSARPPARTTPETPSRLESQAKPADKPSAAAASRPAPEGAADVGSRAGGAPIAVDKGTSVPATQDGSVAEKQQPATGGRPSEPTGPPAGHTAQAEPQASGWKSAVFAPKNAVVTAAPPSNPGVRPGELVEPGADVIDPVLLEHPKVKYPGEAKRRKLEAVVRVRVLVDEQGTVLEAKVDEPVGSGFDQSAIEVALKARFIPATKGTVPVKMWTVLPIVYRLK